ncbi:hypothetical protein ACGFNF_20775 [Micromonospora sp. NPDC048868]|uniref:hypothetical protein n=1 Tax=Micromonospora sp. NPDC048868 TaxID=3364258 RepID=UPI00371A38ED
MNLGSDYDGHTCVDGSFESPTVVLRPAADPWQGLATYRTDLVERGFAPAAAAMPRAGWWTEPIFCGWGAQCAAAPIPGQPMSYPYHLSELGPALVPDGLPVAFDLARQDRYDGRLGRLAVGVIKFLDQATSIERAYVFVYTDDGHLWGNWWDGSRWAWTDIGTPGGTTVSAPVGAVAVQTAPGSQAVPYIYVIGADGHLWWSRKNNTGQWTWTDQGVPAGVTLHRFADPVGAVNLRLSPTQPDLPQVFVLDVQGNLWRHGFDGLTWRWYGHGSPQPSYNAHDVGLVAVQNGPNAASRPEAFIGVNGQVLELTWYNDAWTWSTHSSSGTTYVRHAGTIAVQDGWDTQQRPYVLCDLEGGPLRTNWWTGTQRVWSLQAGTDAAGLDPSCGDAVALPNRFTGTRYPYVFYWSRQQPMRLMLTWWG